MYLAVALIACDAPPHDLNLRQSSTSQRAAQTTATQAPEERRDDKLKLIERNGKYGYVDGAGKIVIEPQFVEAGVFSESLAWVKVGKRYGYIDETGHIVIEPEFGEDDPLRTDRPVKLFSDGLAAVRVNNSYGYIDKSGNFIIEPQFEDAEPFSEGLAAVQVGAVNRYKYGYIDKTGQFVIKPQFEEAESFSDGRAKVKFGGKVMFIDRNGEAQAKAGNPLSMAVPTRRPTLRASNDAPRMTFESSSEGGQVQ